MTDPKRGAFSGLLALLRPFRAIVSISVALGMAGGLAITLLLATINNALHSAAGMTQGVILTFAALCVLALISSIISDVGTNYVGQRIIAALRKDLGEKVLSAPIGQIEGYRSHRLIPVLTHDVDTISDFSFAFTPLAIAATVTLGCLGYLAYLSVPMFLMMLVAIVIGSAVQFIAGGKGIQGFDLARSHEDELQRYYNAIASGAKELRMHRPRRFRMNTQRIQETADRIADIQVRSVNIYILAKTFGSMLFFVVIGLALAMQAYHPNPDPSVITGFVLVLLYMKGPLEHLLGYLPVVGKAKIAFGRISELSQRFSSPEPHLLMDASEAPQPVVNHLELRGVRYSPPPVTGSQPFHLGPIDLSIKQGDIVFIVGENGSGKTTLIKLLLGLYPPQAGQILLNGNPVTDPERDDYRQLFTTVFADYYLFDDLVQGSAAQSLDSATKYLERLEIAHKVSVKNGVFSTTDLSTGQRKRLALVNAWLEERPVLVFDEWAADQDPAFRRIFYTELLPDLKRLGKTLIVISHDDRYFDIADHVVRLRAGQVVHEMTPA